jgi:hypothetical protein
MFLEILLVGFIIAAISYFLKPVGMIIAAISVVPLAYSFIMGPIQVSIDPSSFQQVTDGMVINTTNYITDYLLSYPGAALFGAMVGLFAPSDI